MATGASDERASLEPPDGSLAKRVQVGDRQAFEELARRYLRPVHAIAMSYLREPADVEDAAQETFLRALDRIHTFDSERPFAPWLYQIARNVSRNRRRSLGRSRVESWPASDVPSLDPDPATGLERREIRHLVAQAVDRLPTQQRTALRLFDIEAYSAEDVAEFMGITAGTVRSHVHHARRALKAGLAHLLAGEDTR